MPRLTVALIAAAVFAGSGLAHAASADEEFDVCVDKYLAASGQSFTCTICGVEAGCTGDSCYWGSLKGSANDIGPVTSAGTQLYCLNKGGTAVTAAGPIAMQGRGFDGALRDMKSGATSLAVGGLVEYASLNDFSRYGAAVPFAKNFGLGTERMDLNVAGNLLFSSSDVLQQYGFNARPTLRQFRGEPGSMRHVLAGSVPLQLVFNKGDGLDSALSYHLGAGAIAGLVDSSGKIGGGLTADVLYEGGVQVPFQLVGRYAIPLSGGQDVAVQLGVSSEATAGGGLVDDLQQSVMVGYDGGDWLYGGQLYRQGDDAWVFGVGVSNTTRAAKLAAGTDDAYRPGEPKPGEPRKKVEAVPVDALVVVDAGEATASALLRAAITQALEKVRVTPRPKADTERLVSQSAPGVGAAALGPKELGELRRAANVPVVIHVVLRPASAGRLLADLRVEAAGISARRSLVTLASAIDDTVADAVVEILAKIGNDSLRVRAAELPLPPAPPPPPPPSLPPPTPPATDPDARAPSGDADGGAAPPPPASDGCSKDTDCKGDRVCEGGRCVSPK